ncbi:MAG: 3-oxoacyl-ACP reductase [Gammaproteobacteria bacterium]|nr:3-oxoacyl-ACP reductase [Gammaproteobacteria bacterium]
MRLKDKRAVVTGGSSGIGRAIAEAFAREGAEVVVNYARSREAAEAVVARIEADGGHAHAVQADVADGDAVDALVARADALLGGIDIWANVAGADILTGAAADAPDTHKLARLIDVDLRGTMLCAWAVTPRLHAHGGVILNTSWDLALVGMGERNPEMFAATKAGISGFTRSLARSLAPAIRVNEIAPGWIATAFAESHMAEDYRRRVIEQTPLRRFGTPADVAAAAVFLCSDEAAFITGQTLKVNGGLSS